MISVTPAKSQASFFRPNLNVNSRPSYNLNQDTYVSGLESNANESHSKGRHFPVSAEERVENLQELSANAALKGYRNDIMSETRGEKLWLAESKGPSRENLSLIDSNDPIQNLLLVETALSDSKDFEILSPEEVEEMKIKCDSISQRIEQTRQDLMIQSKYSDATVTVAKLYSSKLSYNSTPGNFINQKEDEARQNEQEFRESERRCEELAIKLFRFEKELMITQGKLLRHTARILQMNHEDTKSSRRLFDNSEDTYTYTNGIPVTQSINDDFLFDERSLYQALEGFGKESNSMGMASKVQMEMIIITEQKLEALNHRARKIIKKLNLNAGRNSEQLQSRNKNSESQEMVELHLELLEQSLKTIEFEQEKLHDQYKNLRSQNKNLLEEKEILQRQIQQQRDLNSRSSPSTEIQLNNKIDELSRMTEAQAKNLDDIYNLQQEVNSLNEKLVIAQQKESLHDQPVDKKSPSFIREVEMKTRMVEEKLHTAEEKARKADEATYAALTEIEIRDQSISRLEKQLRKAETIRSSAYIELESKTASLEAQSKSLIDELNSVTSAKVRLDVLINEKENQLVDNKREINEAQMDIARLQTEVTIAKTELDIAYGSRAQRAAQVTSNPVMQKEIDKLTDINNQQVSEIIALKTKLAELQAEYDAIIRELRNELTEIIGEYEKMTKASIEWEKERENLEETIDSLREAKENIEAQFSDERVQWIGMRSPEAEALSPNSTSTAVLKNEFKKMIRDIRAENAKVLKAEQSERRRLEEELRNFRKSQLSPNSLNAL